MLVCCCWTNDSGKRHKTRRVWGGQQDVYTANNLKLRGVSTGECGSVWRRVRCALAVTTRGQQGRAALFPLLNLGRTYFRVAFSVYVPLACGYLWESGKMAGRVPVFRVRNLRVIRDDGPRRRWYTIESLAAHVSGVWPTLYRPVP